MWYDAREAGVRAYKVVETSTVAAETLEGILNEWTGRGWNLEGVHFAMKETSHRPTMAFVFFTREEGEAAPGERPLPPADPPPRPGRPRLVRKPQSPPREPEG